MLLFRCTGNWGILAQKLGKCHLRESASWKDSVGVEIFFSDKIENKVQPTRFCDGPICRLTVSWETQFNQETIRSNQPLNKFKNMESITTVLQKKLNFINNLDAQITAARQSNAKIWLQNIWILMFGTAIPFMLLTNSISSEEISAHYIRLFGKYQGEKLF